MLIEAAKKMPDVKFILIGLNEYYLYHLKELKLENTELYGKVSYDELIKLYGRAKVYSQLSIFEGMQVLYVKQCCAAAFLLALM